MEDPDDINREYRIIYNWINADWYIEFFTGICTRGNGKKCNNCWIYINSNVYWLATCIFTSWETFIKNGCAKNVPHWCCFFNARYIIVCVDDTILRSYVGCNRFIFCWGWNGTKLDIIHRFYPKCSNLETTRHRNRR